MYGFNPIGFNSQGQLPDSSSLPVVIANGQYRNDRKTPIAIGANAGGDGISNNVYLQEDVATLYGQRVTPKAEIETTTTPFNDLPTVTERSTLQHDAASATYNARGGTLIHDEKNDRYLWYGGTDGTTRYNAVWEKDMSVPGSPWRRLSPSGTAPTATNLHAAVYVRGTATTGGADKAFMIVWGGGNPSDSNAMAYLDVSTPGSEVWGSITQTGAPTVRSYLTRHMTVTPGGDASQKNIYLFGGWAASRENNLVRCTFDVDSPGAVTWTTLKANGAVGNPSARSGVILDYKASTNKIYLFGGYNGTTYLADFWEYDIAGNTWTQKAVSGTAPAGTEFPAGGYDATNNRFWYTGGWTGTAATGKNNIGYISNVGSGETYNSVRADDGGISGNQYYSGHSSSANWFDKTRGWLIVGPAYLLDDWSRYTYVIDTTDSTSTDFPVYGLTDGQFLTARDAPAYVWNPDRNEWVIFNGYGNMSDNQTIALGTHLNDIWTYHPDENKWRSAMQGDKGLVSTEGVVGVYDTTRDRIIAFSGLTGTSLNHNETFSLTADAFGNYAVAKMRPTGTRPSVRWLGWGVYDATNDRAIFGWGGTSGGPVSTVWALNFSSNPDGVWQQLTPSGAPTATIGAAYAVDETNKKVYIFGGATNGALTTVSNQMVSFDYSTTNGAFSILNSTNAVGRRTGAAGFDPVGNQFIVFGGFNGTAATQSLQYYSIAGNTWTTTVTPTKQPDARRSLAAAYFNSKFYIFAGRTDASIWYNDTWSLTPNYGTPNNSVWYKENPAIFNQMYTAVTGLTTNNGYHWQGWATNINNVDSVKSSFGNNLENVPDFGLGSVATAYTKTHTVNSLFRKASSASHTTSAIMRKQFSIAHTTSSWRARARNHTTDALKTAGSVLSAPVFGAVSTKRNSARVTSDSWTHTTTGSNRLLIVSIIMDPTDTTSSVTYAGVGMTLLNAISTGGTGTQSRIETYYLLNPALGANTVSYNLSGGGSVTNGAFAAHYTDVSGLDGGNYGPQNPTSPANYNTTSSQNSALTLVTLTSTQNDNTFGPNGSWTERLDISSASVGAGRVMWLADVTANAGTTNFAPVGLTDKSAFVWGTFLGSNVTNTREFRTNHTTDALKAAAAPSYTKTHSTDTFKRRQSATTHTTNALKRKQDTRTHTTNALKRAATTRTHSTDALKRKQFTLSHTTSANKKKANNTLVHTTSAFKRSQFTRTHTTDTVKHVEAVRSHTTDTFKRNQFTKTHTTNALKRKTNTVVHTTSANKKRSYLATHTTNTFKRTAFTLSHSTDARIALPPYGTSIYRFDGHDGITDSDAEWFSDSQAFDGSGTSTYAWTQVAGNNGVNFLHGQGTSAPTSNTSSITQVRFRVYGSQNGSSAAWGGWVTIPAPSGGWTWTKLSNIEVKFWVQWDDEAIHAEVYSDGLAQTLVSNTAVYSSPGGSYRSVHDTEIEVTYSNIVPQERTHSTDAFLRKRSTAAHSTSANKRKATVASHTTNANKRAVNVLSHTTNTLLRERDIRTHTTDSFLRKQNTRAHTTNALLRRQLTLTHSTNALKRKAFTTSHTTSSNKRTTNNLRSHTADALKRKAYTVTHTTDANLRPVRFTKTHTTNALLRKTFTTQHTTNALKRKANAVSHTTGALVRKQNTVTQTVDANKRATYLRTHTTDAYRRRGPYVHSFADATIGQQPAGWTKQWYTSAGNFTVDNSTFTNPDNRVIVETHTGNNDVVLTRDAVGAVQDAEIVAKVRSTNVSSYQLQLYLHGSGDQNNKNAWYMTLHNGFMIVEGWQNNTYFAPAGQGINYVWAANTWYWMRFRITGQNIQAKVWQDGQAEPGWQLSFSDARVGGAGWVGIGSYGPAGTHYFDNVSIAVDGATAPIIETYTPKHTTSANKRKADNVVSHTTNALLRKTLTTSHTTNSLKRKAATATHTTNANKRKQSVIAHTTNANKKRAYFVAHTTSANKRKQLSITHTTSSNKRKVFSTAHTTSAAKRTRNTLNHTTDTFIDSGKRYWVGGDGNWNDTAHWAYVSGGAGGASVPNQYLDVIFDNNAVIDPETIYANIDMSMLSSIEAKSITKSVDMSHMIALVGDYTNGTQINLYGDFTGSGNVYVISYGLNLFADDGQVHYIDAPYQITHGFTMQAGATTTYISNVQLSTHSTTNPPSGTYETHLYSGTLVLAGNGFTSDNLYVHDGFNLDMGTGAIHIYDAVLDIDPDANVTNIGSVYIYTGANSTSTQPTQVDVNLYGETLDVVSFEVGYGTNNIPVYVNGSINASSAIQLNAVPIYFTAGATYTAPQFFFGGYFDGSDAHYTILRSQTPGQQYYFVQAEGDALGDYVDAQDSNVGPVRFHKTANFIDSGNNTGWYGFAEPVHTTDSFLRYTPGADIATLVDDFEVGTHPDYAKWAEHPIFDGGGAVIEDGKVKLLANQYIEGEGYRTQALQSLEPYSIIGSELTWQIPSWHVVAGDELRIDITLIAPDSNQPFYMNIYPARVENNVTVSFWNRTDGGTYGEYTVDPNDLEYFKLREAGGTLYLESSPDGYSFTPIASGTPDDLVRVYTRFFAINSGGEYVDGTSSYYYVDNVNVLPTLTVDLTHTTDSNKRKATTVSHSTSTVIRKANTRSHTTSSVIRKQQVRTHTTNALLRKQVALTHTTSANKRKVNTLVHTTSANKKRAYSATHTTSANKKRLYSVSHSTSANKRKLYTLAHTTDIVKRSQNVLTHSTNALKRTRLELTHTTNSFLRKRIALTHSTDAFLRATRIAQHATDTNKRKAYVVAHSTDSNKRKAYTVVHTTDSNKRKVTLVTHTTSANKRKALQVAHTTSANRRKLYTVSHTTSSNKRKTGITVAHTTSALLRTANVLAHSTDTLKRTQNVRTHSTNSLLRKVNTVSHTTNANKKRTYSIVHTTSANKRKLFSLEHTTNANKKKANNVLVHSTNALKRKQFNLVHTTDTLLREINELAHSTDTLKRTANALAHSTDANKRSVNVLTHSTNALKRAITTKTHTTDSLLRTRNAVAHSTSSNKRKALTRTHTADAFKRTGNEVYHNTDANKKRSYTRTHTTSANKRKTGLVRTHTTNAVLRTRNLVAHLTDANKRKITEVAHTTDSLLRTQTPVAHTADTVKRTQNVTQHSTDSALRKAYSVAHSTDTNKKRSYTVVHTTSANKRKAYITTHTTAANKRRLYTRTHTTSANKKRSGNLRTHTTNALLRKQVVTTHSTSSVVRKANITAHTTSSVIRKQNVVAHSTDSNKRKITLVAHTTDSFLRRANEVNHTTSANKRKATVAQHTTSSVIAGRTQVSHTTDANKKRSYTVSHTTSSNKRKTITITHTTSALLRKQFTKLHTTSANKRKATAVTHTTSLVKRKRNVVTHSTNSLLRKQFVKTHSTNSLLRTRTYAAHSTDSLLRKARTTAHSTSSVLRRANTLSHGTNANKRTVNTLQHTTDSLLAQRHYVQHETDTLLRTRTSATHATDANKRKVSEVSHTTQSYTRPETYARHSTDAYTLNPRGKKKVLVNGVWVPKPVRVLENGVWVVKPVKYFDGTTWATATY